MNLLVSILMMIAADAPAIAADADEADKAAIKGVIEDYFDGIGAADAERLNRAFAADKAAMIGVVNTENGPELRAFKDMEAVIANWAGDPNPEGVGRDGEIMDINIVDGRIAMVMFRYKDEYYDVLTLVKLGDSWKIATKTFVQR